MPEDKNNKHSEFEQYLQQGEPERRERAEAWSIAIGLQDVDRLKTSPYLLDTAKQHIEGKLGLASAQKRIADYYRTEEGRKLAATRTAEADIVATRPVSLQFYRRMLSRLSPRSIRVCTNGCSMAFFPTLGNTAA